MSTRPTARTRAAVVRRVERAAGPLATRALTEMERTLPWFATLSPDRRSWVGLIVQSGIAAFASWLQQAGTDPDVPVEVFAAAPREMARAVSLQQTLHLVRIAVGVVEDDIDELAGAGDATWLREAALRYSREIAFAAALVYARAAEERGAWDARLESLAVDSVLRGPDESLLSRAAALGWRSPDAVAVVAGSAPVAETESVLDGVHRVARHTDADVLAGVQGERMVVVVGVTGDVLPVARLVSEEFGPGPVVVGPVVGGVHDAWRSAAAALAGLRAAPAWPGAPRPVPADALLPERALAGDGEAHRQLVEDVYSPLLTAGGSVLETLVAYLDTGGSLEATARRLYVHPNTVRYRLRRVTDITGYAATEPRDGFALQVGLALGRLTGESPTL